MSVQHHHAAPPSYRIGVTLSISACTLELVQLPMYVLLAHVPLQSGVCRWV